MGIFSWLYGKGIAGAIASDLTKKYVGIKSLYPEEREDEILERVWNYWLTLNAGAILEEDDKHKIARFHIIEERNAKKTTLDYLTTLRSLFDLYQDILFIETELTSSSGKPWMDCQKVFLGIARRHGLDYSGEHKSMLMTISALK